MVKLVKKPGVKPVNQTIAQKALDEQIKQEKYINSLREIKGEMYDAQVETGETEENEEKTETEVKQKGKRKEIQKGELRLRVDTELADIYKLIAVQEGVTVSSYISNILETYLIENQKEIKALLKMKNKFLS